jgi:hypothetical protein
MAQEEQAPGSIMPVTEMTATVDETEDAKELEKI